MIDIKLARRDLLRATTALPLVAIGGRLRAEDGDADLRAAFYFAYPLYEFARSEQTIAQCVGQSGLINIVKQRVQLADASSRNVTAPNNDTIYSSAFLDLSAGPVEVQVPDVRDRYFSCAFMDALTDNFAYIGTRATNGRGGRFWIAGPQWAGRAPAGVTLFRSSSNDVWMLARTLVDGPADLEKAKAIQAQVKVIVPPGRSPARGFTTKATPVPQDPALFLAVVNEMLRRSPGGKGQFARAVRFRALGIGIDGPQSAALLKRWGDYLPTGVADLREGFLFRDLVSDGWSYQPRGVGEFGADDHLRAMIALGGIAALGEREAMYFHANFEKGGARLSGEHAYRWRVPPGGVPVRGFWSLTMYDPQADGRYFLVDNPIHRYSIGDRTPGLVRNPDGSIDILIQHDQPKGPLAANWLPAPAGPMRLALRAYLPEHALIERKWRVPPLERVSAQ
ncbi:DUF1254 domain-containing protein [Sphingomonas pruni]|uniref:DUF1254 domain-containing protein n=1 Tax=Sphingomonas pruni TaxID=40683 RepID=UPI00082F868E|nr:DUF1254 domain-containing protein [Sphingomonas pruni]